MHELQHGAPVAEVRVAFDEARAIAEIKEQIARRDEAKGEYQDAILVIGQRLIEARKAMPGVRWGGVEKYSEQFIAFFTKIGLARKTVVHYTAYARNPKKLEENRARHRKGGLNSVSGTRARTLTEIRDALLNSTKEEVLAAIEHELREKQHGNDTQRAGAQDNGAAAARA